MCTRFPLEAKGIVGTGVLLGAIGTPLRNDKLTMSRRGNTPEGNFGKRSSNSQSENAHRMFAKRNTQNILDIHFDMVTNSSK